ncbi:MAG: maleylpyruvate isomerase family mycothiol-dependent enzyme [SAR324 cluster bacterium]|nr:maleylpyruvate isomerase family mycothiol-dependent enzyme [SAR324 cluster bacterium]
MLQQAIDFRDESEALFALLDPLSDTDWSRKTQFKNWTINDVVAHLHIWNHAADLSLRDNNAFMEFVAQFKLAMKQGDGHLRFTHTWLHGTKNRELLRNWREFYLEMSDRFAAADPRMRVNWVGPGMSVRSSISARLMETWAHGQEIYDLIGAQRTHTDRIKHIATIGVKTFGWTFINRKLEPPGPPPYVRLTAPSGDIWEWNEPSETECVTGDAVVPGRSVYLIDILGGKGGSCNTLQVETARWGDVNDDGTSNNPDGPPNAMDIMFVIDKIKQIPGAHPHWETQLGAGSPNSKTPVNVVDLALVIDAVRVEPELQYRYIPEGCQ